jgi:hypothetical protein
MSNSLASELDISSRERSSVATSLTYDALMDQGAFISLFGDVKRCSLYTEKSTISLGTSAQRSGLWRTKIKGVT